MPAGSDNSDGDDASDSGRHVPTDPSAEQPAPDSQPDESDSDSLGGESGDGQPGVSQAEAVGGQDPERDADSEWRFTLDDLADDGDDGNVAGSLTSAGPLEPQDIDLENAIFVVVGVIVVTVLVASLIFGF